MDGIPVPFPAELRQAKPVVDSYVQAKLRQFGTILCRRVTNGAVTREQTDLFINDALRFLAQQDAVAQPPRNLRLVIRHDCQSTGCGDGGCVLCQFNPSRLCTRNVKQKYLIDDHLKAKCGAPLRVELVDDSGACHTEGLPPNVQLEMHVLNGEKYKELCPDNTLLSNSQIKSCIISHHQRALLKREGMPEDQLRITLPLERGQSSLSDLALTTSSEALLSGKAPTFRLLIWAVDPSGEPVPYVTYVASESFVVATKRVKHAIKSDIPSVVDHISKLMHIGKATVDKLMDLRQAFHEEGFEVLLPDDLLHVERVGQFKQLVEVSENNNDLKTKLRNVLKLSPEKWEEVCQHALSAVMPDFRNRVWWYTPMQLGLLYACKNGAVLMDNPMAVVKLGPTPDSPHTVVPVQSLTPQDFNALPKLKQQALQSWYMANHPGWAIYTEGSTEGPVAPTQAPAMHGLAPPPGPAAYLGAPAPAPMMPMAGGASMHASSPPLGGFQDPYAAPSGAPRPSNAAQMMPPAPLGGARVSNSSPFAMLQQQQQAAPPQQVAQLAQHQQAAGAETRRVSASAGFPMGMPADAQPSTSGLAGAAMQGVQQQAGVPGQPGAAPGSGRSPFAANMLMANIADAFPSFMHGQPGGATAASGVAVAGPPGVGPGPGADAHAGGPGSLTFSGLGPLDMLKTEELMDRGYSLFNLQQSLGVAGPGVDVMRSADWMPSFAGAASFTMMDVPPAGGAMPLAQQIEGGGAGDTAMETRRLSMKLNSMSLDLDKVIAEHSGS